MKKALSYSLFILVVVSMLGLNHLPLGRTQSSSQDFDVNKAIAAGDHPGLAKYYKAQADVYRQKAALHENMVMDYSKSLVHYKGMDSTFKAHCSALRESALKSAAQYDDLAKEEEKLAAQPK